MALDYGQKVQRDKTHPNEKGLKTTIYGAPMDWFDSIAGFVAAPANPGDRVTIDGTHTFLAGKGFIEFYSELDTGQITAELVGDPGGKGFGPMSEFFVPGDDKALAEIFAYAKDDDWMFLIPTATDQMIQLGREGLACKCNPSFTTGTSSGGRNGWLVQVQAYSGRIQYYEGDVTLKPDPV